MLPPTEGSCFRGDRVCAGAEGPPEKGNKGEAGAHLTGVSKCPG